MLYNLHNNHKALHVRTYLFQIPIQHKFSRSMLEHCCWTSPIFSWCHKKFSPHLGSTLQCYISYTYQENSALFWISRFVTWSFHPKPWCNQKLHQIRDCKLPTDTCNREEEGELYSYIYNWGSPAPCSGKKRNCMRKHIASLPTTPFQS